MNSDFQVSSIKINFIKNEAGLSQLIKSKQQEIDQIWDNEQRQRQCKMTNGEILNVVKMVSEPGQIVVECNCLNYKDYFAQTRGLELGITPLGVSGITYYCMDKERVFLIGLRAKEVNQYPDYFELIPSGSIDTEILSVEKQVKLELKEELGIAENFIKKCENFCLVKDGAVYDVGVAIEVEADIVLKLNKQEYTQIKYLKESELASFLSQENIVPTSKQLFCAWREFESIRKYK